MNPSFFLHPSSFNLLSEAPGGVAKLRELILQLAVRGQLVPQEKGAGKGKIHHEGHEEPAFAKATAGKHEGEKEGERIGGPYALPKEWRWTTLAQIGKVNPRNETHDDLDVGFAPMAVISHRYGVTPEYERRFWRDVKKGFTHFAEGDIGVAKITPCFENGKSAVFRNVPNGVGAGTTELHVFRPDRATVVADYVWVFLKSPGFRAGGEAVMTGSAGQKRVPADYFAKTPFPLPPLAEQKRIVARVDELMGRCDELEARQKERNARHTVLVSSCLHALTSKPSSLIPQPSSFPFFLHPSSFNLLFTSPESVAELRKTILQLAVQGRLVPQERIHHEGHEEHEGGEGNRQVVDGPYPLPQGWVWARLGSLGAVLGGGTPSKSHAELWCGDLPWVSPKDMKKPFIRDSQDHISHEALSQSAVRLIPRRSVLMVVRGMILAHSFPVAVNEVEVTINQDMKAIIPANPGMTEYLLLACCGSTGRILSLVERSSHGTCKLNTEKLLDVVLGIPPLPEQKRIVAKVSELMALCDALEAKLTQSRADADTFASAVVHHLCNQADHSKGNVL